MRYKLNENNVAAEELGGEVIIIHLELGTYYSMQGSGVDIWNGIVGGLTVQEISQALNGDETEIQDLVDQLAADQLIVPSPDLTGGKPLAGAGPYSNPVLNKYTDMKDLLLVDPIHEVSEQGWPILPDKAALPDKE